MKTALRAAVAFAALALSTSAYAQSAANRQDGRFGLGVGITSGGTSPDLGYLFFVPLQLAPNLRVEPFIGWQRTDMDNFPAGLPNGTPAFSNSGKTSDFTLGAGVFFVQPVASQLQLYAGGRLASWWQSNKDNGGGKMERRNTILGAVGGAEYLPIPRVALGAEFQLSYISFGDTKWSQAGQSVEGNGGSGDGTMATLFVRVYLF